MPILNVCSMINAKKIRWSISRRVRFRHDHSPHRRRIPSAVRYWVSALRIAAIIADNGRVLVDALLVSVNAQLGVPPQRMPPQISESPASEGTNER
jgi:hypothetical protein